MYTTKCLYSRSSHDTHPAMSQIRKQKTIQIDAQISNKNR